MSHTWSPQAKIAIKRLGELQQRDSLLAGDFIGTKKNGKTPKASGHAFGGLLGTFEVSCECGARFNAKYRPSQRQMWRDHVREVIAARRLRDEFLFMAQAASERLQDELRNARGRGVAKAAMRIFDMGSAISKIDAMLVARSK